MVQEIERKDEKPDIMTSEDRDRINEFSRLLARRAELDGKRKSREKILQLHEDAVDELSLVDEEDEVMHAVGDVFLIDNNEQVQATLESTKAELNREITEVTAELAVIGNRLKSLKATLYAKFGNTINLEESV